MKNLFNRIKNAFTPGEKTDDQRVKSGEPISEPTTITVDEREPGEVDLKPTREPGEVDLKNPRSNSPEVDSSNYGVLPEPRASESEYDSVPPETPIYDKVPEFENQRPGDGYDKLPTEAEMEREHSDGSPEPSTNYTSMPSSIEELNARDSTSNSTEYGSIPSSLDSDVNYGPIKNDGTSADTQVQTNSSEYGSINFDMLEAKKAQEANAAQYARISESSEGSQRVSAPYGSMPSLTPSEYSSVGLSEDMDIEGQGDNFKPTYDVVAPQPRSQSGEYGSMPETSTNDPSSTIDSSGYGQLPESALKDSATDPMEAAKAEVDSTGAGDKLRDNTKGGLEDSKSNDISSSVPTPAVKSADSGMER